MDFKHTIDEANPSAYECDQLINMVTKAVLPEKIQEDMNTMIEVGEETCVQFVSE